MSDAPLRLYNTLTRSKEDFVPIDPDNVRMYVCGPTVYDYAHIGNARPAIVFDVLFRLLRHRYGAENVTYVRNITDVDDKINARALRDHGAEIAAGRLTLNEAIRKVTEPTYEQYQRDVTALGCLAPTHQPRATEFVLPRGDGKADMVTLIQSLIDRGHAYVANGEVLFDVMSMPDYGGLSKRNLEDQQAGARVAVDAHKKNPADFVLWKESSADEPGWAASFRQPDGTKAAIRGRPGWHIECSAMSAAYLGEIFDIHGGGLDLIFPHHENEIAQSRCAHGTEVMANVWMHNGFLQVEGRKMSKSDGNFVTIHELLETEKFGGRKWPGEVLRLAMMMTHYREPIDFSVRRLEEAEKVLTKLYRCFDEVWPVQAKNPDAEVVGELLNDLQTYAAINVVSWSTSSAVAGEMMAGFTPLSYSFEENAGEVLGAARLLGLMQLTPDQYLRGLQSQSDGTVNLPSSNFELRSDPPTVLTSSTIKDAIDRRLAFIAAKNWPEADRIRDELLAQGIQLKDGKDPATGERVTTWEVKR